MVRESPLGGGANRQLEMAFVMGDGEWSIDTRAGITSPYAFQLQFVWTCSGNIVIALFERIGLCHHSSWMDCSPLLC